MKSLWNDQDAASLVGLYATRGVGEDLALRVYTSRLLGETGSSCCTGAATPRSRPAWPISAARIADVLCVKGSGWDMGSIKPEGLPAVRIAPLLRLRRRETLSDEEMVRQQRANLLDPASPNPSVETLLHAPSCRRNISITPIRPRC